MTVGGKAGQRIRGTVPGALDLNTYLGTYSEVATPARLNINVYLAGPGQTELRAVVELAAKRRFEFIMVATNSDDEALFDQILRTITFPFG